MAQMEGLYFGMGIDTSQLNSDFVSAEKTINQNLARINREMQLVQIKGQVKLEGLEESASEAEKLKLQEDALTRQIELQQDKIILLSASYEHLVKMQGEHADATQKVEYQLAREQLAMQRLTNQMADLNEQQRIALGFNFEALSLVEPAFKLVDAAAVAGRIATTSVFPAKVAAAAGTALIALVAGSVDATNELREENPAKILDESFQQAAINIDNSWQRINDSTQRGTERMHYYSRRTAEMQKRNEQTLVEMQKEGGRAKPFDFKIFPELNDGDFVRFIRVMENYRTSESIVNAIELIKQSDSLIGKLLATATAISYITMNINIPVVEWAQTSIDSFRELSAAANELNLPLERTNDLITKINLSGADYDDVRDFVRGVQDAVIKGEWDDPEVLALEKYGVSIQDEKGKLLDFDETLDRLYQGWLKAREAGEAEAYIIMTNGQAVQDVLPYFEKLAQAEEDIAKIKWGTVDYATLNELSHKIKLAETQTNEFKNALSSLAVPAANIALQSTFEHFKGLTEIIEENREEIIYWSFVLMEAVGAFQNFQEELKNGAKNKLLGFWEDLKGLNEEYDITGTLKNFFSDDEPIKDLSEEAKENLIPFYEELKRLEEEFGVISALENFLPEGFTEELDDATNNYLVPFYQEIKNIKEELSLVNKLKSFLPDWKSYLPDWLVSETESISIFDSIIERAKKDLEEFKRANEEARKEIQKTKDDSAGLAYSAKRIAKYKTELEELNLDIQFGDDYSYQKALAKNKLWYEEAMKNAKQYAAEKAIIEELNNAKLEKIEKDHSEKIKEYWKNAADISFEMTHTAFEKELRDIELWKDAQKEKAAAGEETAAIIANAAAKEAQAFEREVDRIKGTMQSLDDKIFALDHSQYENDLRRIQQEYIRGIQEAQKAGTLPLMKDKLDYLYQRQKEELDKKALKDSEYKKSPLGEGQQRGGNGIVVIGGDTILDDGAKQAQAKNIDLLTDENKIREKLLPNLTEAGRELVNAQQAAKNFSDTQNLINQTAEKPTSPYTLIEGDQVVSMPEMPTANIQEFNSALQQTTLELEQSNPAEAIASAENQLTESLSNALPINYFQNMATGMENVSDMQLRLIESTMNLIDAQEAYKTAMANLPSGGAKEQGGLQQLSYANQRELEPLLTTRSQGNNWQLGFDMDAAGLAVGLGALLAGIGGAPLTAPIAALIAGGAMGAGLGKGTFDATNTPQATLGSTDLTPLLTPLTNIESKFETVITPLTTIENIVGQIFSAMSNSEAQPINVSPNVDIDLGGAYVFDNDMKLSLVEDITSKVVTAITDAVEKATSQRTYGFSV